MNFVFLGPPGSGKGTQATQLVQKVEVVHISTGQILRNAIEKRSKLGMHAQKYMHTGMLVPDELIVGMVEDRLSQQDCRDGFVLDGFPRTLPQAKQLDLFLKKSEKHLDAVFFIDCPDKVSVERLSRRKTCPRCGVVYNSITHRPKRENECDRCKVPLVLRGDDKPETVIKRLQVYRKLTEPVIKYYKKTHQLVRIDGSDSPAEVFENVTRFVDSRLTAMR